MRRAKLPVEPYPSVDEFQTTYDSPYIVHEFVGDQWQPFVTPGTLLEFHGTLKDAVPDAPMHYRIMTHIAGALDPQLADKVPPHPYRAPIVPQIIDERFLYIRKRQNANETWGVSTIDFVQGFSEMERTQDYPDSFNDRQHFLCASYINALHTKRAEEPPAWYGLDPKSEDELFTMPKAALASRALCIKPQGRFTAEQLEQYSELALLPDIHIIKARFDSLRKFNELLSQARQRSR